MSLDKYLSILEAKPVLDTKESTYGLWETNLQSFLKFISIEEVPYPSLKVPVGAYIYMLFAFNGLNIPICVKPSDMADFLRQLDEVFRHKIEDLHAEI